MRARHNERPIRYMSYSLCAYRPGGGFTRLSMFLRHTLRSILQQSSLVSVAASPAFAPLFNCTARKCFTKHNNWLSTHALTQSPPLRMPGACFSKAEVPSHTAAQKPVSLPQPAPAPDAPAEMATKKVYIIYYSMYGHIAALAKAVKQGVDSVEGVEGVLYQVAETLPAEVLDKMHAPAKPADIPVIDPHIIDQADGFVFGFPTRFGMMCAQMKAFFDATGGHWSKGSLAGKAASMFTSTASQGSGQETTIMTAVTQLAHHGMIFVPTGYGVGPAMFGNDAVRGGGPWGAGTLAGPDGSRQPTAVELEQAVYQGKTLATVVKKLTA